MLDSMFGYAPVDLQLASEGGSGLHSRVLPFTPRNSPSTRQPIRSMEDRTMTIDPECIAPHVSPITSYLRDRAAETVITVPEATNADNQGPVKALFVNYIVDKGNGPVSGFIPHVVGIGKVSGVWLFLYESLDGSILSRRVENLESMNIEYREGRS